MEYERIHELETGMLSPSKLRMKLLGAKNQRKKDEEANSNSSRTSPSKLHDSEFINNTLLAPHDGDYDEASGLEEASSMSLTGLTVSILSECDQPNDSLPRGNGDAGQVKMPLSKTEGGNSSMVYPLRTQDEENLDLDSNASSSSFEFHKDDNNNSVRNHIGRSFQRQMPSKWNDAEKWIMNRHSQVNSSKKNTSQQSQSSRLLATNMVRVAPVEGTNYDQKLIINRIMETKRVNFCLPFSSQANGVNASSHITPQSNDSHEPDHQSIGTSMIRSVSMRDTGTEMTPIASQEPSQTTTPIGSTTPLRSPAPSVPSTPKRGGPDSTQVESHSHTTQTNNKNLSEQDLKVKTRREIVALGVQLGKTNIAAWASKDEKEKSNVAANTMDTRELDRIEFERRAMAWEEAEKSKHTARYKRVEIQIQAWESRQKATLAAELRRIEAKVEQIRAQAQAKIVKKISMARQQSEEKQATLGAQKNKDEERIAAKLEYIRQTGKKPAPRPKCFRWLR